MTETYTTRTGPLLGKINTVGHRAVYGENEFETDALIAKGTKGIFRFPGVKINPAQKGIISVSWLAREKTGTIR